MSYINEGFMVVWHDDGPTDLEIAEEQIEEWKSKCRNLERINSDLQTDMGGGLLRFKMRAIEELQAAGLHDGALLVMRLPTSGRDMKP